MLSHESGSITTHYNAAELREVLEAMEFIATDNQRESHLWYHRLGDVGAAVSVRFSRSVRL